MRLLALCLLLATAAWPAHAQGDFTQCGFGCPPGFSMIRQGCNLSACGGRCPNQTTCRRNAGAAQIAACGFECPRGFHAVRQRCNLSACPGQCPNQVVCQSHRQGYE